MKNSGAVLTAQLRVCMQLSIMLFYVFQNETREDWTYLQSEVGIHHTVYTVIHEPQNSKDGLGVWHYLRKIFRHIKVIIA